MEWPYVIEAGIGIELDLKAVSPGFVGALCTVICRDDSYG